MVKKKKTKKKKAARKPQFDPLNQIPKITPHPTAGPKITEFEDKLDEQLGGNGEKRGPGRPRKQQPPEQIEPEGLDAAIVPGVVKMPFELWAISQKIDGLALTDTEAAQIAKPIKQLLDHYLPQIPAIAYAWIALTANGFWIMRTRLLLIAAIKEQNSHQVLSAQADKGQGGPRPPASQPTEQGVNISQLKTKKV